MIIGFACGIFDLFHPGHVIMLKECRANCDYLIVALNKAENVSPEINPNKRSPIFDIRERKMIMESCRYVDEVLQYNSEEELYEIMRSLKIDIRFLGDDYMGKPITGADLNLKLHYLDRSHNYSSTLIFNRIADRLNDKHR